MVRKVNVLLIDDNPQFLRAARELIAALPYVDRVDCANSGAEALARAAKSRPHIVLTDLAMSNMNGFEVIRRLRTDSAPPQMAVMTVDASPQHRAAALRMGAEDCLAKHELGTVIPQMIASMVDANESCR